MPFGQHALSDTPHSTMDLDPYAVLVPYIYGKSHINFHRVIDGEVTAEAPLGHAVIRGTSQDDMIVTIGHTPPSAIIIGNRHTPDKQQLVSLAHMPKAVAISPAKDTIAVILETGLSASDLSHLPIES